MTRPPIEAIEARANAATPGPWRYRGKSNTVHESPGREEFEYGPKIFGFDDGVDEIRNEDASFLVHARTDIPALLEYIRALERHINFEPARWEQWERDQGARGSE